MAGPLRAIRQGCSLSPELVYSWHAFLLHRAACAKAFTGNSQEVVACDRLSQPAEFSLRAVPNESGSSGSHRSGGSWRFGFGFGLVSTSLVALLGGSNAAAEGNDTHGDSVSRPRGQFDLHGDVDQTAETSNYTTTAKECRHRTQRLFPTCQSPGHEAGDFRAPKGRTYAEYLICDPALTGELSIAHITQPQCLAGSKVHIRATRADTSQDQNPPAVILTKVNTSSATSIAIPVPANHIPSNQSNEPSAHQAPQPSSNTSPPAGGDEVTHAQQGLLKRLTSLDLVDTKAVPWPIVAKKGQQVSVRFKLASSVDFSHFVVDATARLGADPQEGSPSSGPLVRVQAYDSLVARHILISPSLHSPSTLESSIQTTQADSKLPSTSISKPPKTTPPEDNSPPSTPAPSDTAHNNDPVNASGLSSSVSIFVFQSLVGERTTEVEYIRRGRFTEAELDAIASGIKIGIGRPDPKHWDGLAGLKEALDGRSRRMDGAQSPPASDGSKPRRSEGLSEGLRGSETDERAARERRKARGRVAAALSKLESMGVMVYGAEKLTEDGGEDGPLDDVERGTWGHLAGYEEQKQEIEDTILLALQRPEVYDRIAHGTRREYESNRPRAILFDGPPGTGKTSCARVIAGRAGVPLLYVPLEAVASKYYGESERLLAAVFNAGKDFPHGCLVFLDEIDALATERNSSTHEATRRVLSVLLRQLDGFEPDRRTIVIAATNRKEDLDAALLSRFDTALTFGLPDERTRREIFAQYARQLSSSERDAVAAATDGMSGRDIRDICEQAERHWASKVIRAQVPQELPTVDEYLRCCKARRQGLAKSDQGASHPHNRPQDLDFV